MADITLAQSEQALIEGWLKAEEQGIPFPVDFEFAWQIAGYARKDNAKKKLMTLSEGVDYLLNRRKTPQGGRPKDLFHLTCDAFKHFCLMAETDKGYQVRQYFIEAEKKWRMVQQHHPEVAESIEERQLDKMIKLQELRNNHLRMGSDTATMHGKEFAMALLGKDDAIVHVEVATIEVLDPHTGATFKGQTLTQIKDTLRDRYGIRLKSGADVQRLLERIGRDDLIAQTPRRVLQGYVPDENLEELYRILGETKQQKLIGE